MEYLPKRRWSTLEKKRSNIMIKAIDKQLKEKRIMRSLKNQNWRDLPRDIPLDSVEVLRFNTTAGNPIKEILLKLNLPDHRSILTDSKVTPTKHGRMKKPYSSPKIRKIVTYRFTLTVLSTLRCSEQYEYVGPEVTRSQEGKRSQDDDKRLCLVDDLKEVLNHIHIKSKPKVNDHYINSQVKD
ncbi:hypothetical protein Tco_1074186 [Tanacetum coccineum]